MDDVLKTALAARIRAGQMTIGQVPEPMQAEVQAAVGA
jgi:hypothetical protein